MQGDEIRLECLKLARLRLDQSVELQLETAKLFEGFVTGPVKAEKPTGVKSSTKTNAENLRSLT